MASLPVSRALLDPKPVELILLLQSKLALAVDCLQTMRPSGTGCDLGTLFLHQHFPSLAFLQHLLLRVLSAVKLLCLGVLLRRLLDISEFLLTGPVELQQLQHFAYRFVGKSGGVQQKAKTKRS